MPAPLPPSEHEDIHAILSEFLDEERYQFSDAGVTAQSGEVTSLYYDIFDQERNVRIIVMGLDTGNLNKVITVYDGDPEEELSMVIYENDNGALTWSATKFVLLIVLAKRFQLTHSRFHA